jgi:hypothetical protein
MMMEGLAGSIDDNGGTAVDAVVAMSEEIEGAMNDLGKNMSATLPTDFSVDIDADGARKSLDKALSGVSRDIHAVTGDYNVNVGANSNSGSEPIMVSVPLYLDGNIITTATSGMQSVRNISRKRALGVT